MKVGLIQSRGIGDIVIALPIAKHFVDRGDDVLWPIDEDYIPAFRAAAPYVEFIPLKKDEPGRWMYELPLERLTSRGCERIIPLYHHLKTRADFINPLLAAIHKFDEYKYSVAGVPFREKWNLQIVRDREREERLFRKIAPEGDFVVCHLQGSGARVTADLTGVAHGRPIVEITSRTNNFFDWLAVIERASLRVMVDSCFSNLTDQLRIAGPKIFIRRSPMAFTPVLLGDWSFAG